MTGQHYYVIIQLEDLAFTNFISNRDCLRLTARNCFGASYLIDKVANLVFGEA